MTLFHCQQSVEKYLKSYLLFKDIDIVRSHNLILLLDLILQKEKISDDLYDKATMLHQFAVDVRYPEITIELTDDDINKAITISKFFREYILILINTVI